MMIHLATDHAGFAHKEAVKPWLESQGFAVIDHGAKFVDENDDYTDTISLAAAAVSKTPESARAVVFGGSGQGEAALANRYPGVRAIVYYAPDLRIATLSREHNNANVFSIGARFVSVEETKDALTVWLNTEPLPDQKYERRNQKVEAITRQLRQV